MSTKAFEFERSLKELEAITAWFESADADLDQGIEKFERGMELSQELRAHLDQVENRIEKIRQRFSTSTASEPSTEPPTSDAIRAPEPDQADLFGA
jgi:exodeoxyribonuclease VII small subunit